METYLPLGRIILCLPRTANGFCLSDHIPESAPRMGVLCHEWVVSEDDVVKGIPTHSVGGFICTEKKSIHMF